MIATFQLSSAAFLNLGQPQNGVLGNGIKKQNIFCRNVGQQPSDHVVCVGFVDFHCIHSLPVNQPFSLKYSSPLARGVVESKTYVIVEQSRVSSITATPIKIDVRGTVNEKLFDPDDWKVWDNLDGEDTNSVVDVSHLKKLLASFKTQSTIPQSMPLVKEESQDFEDISIKIEWDEDEKYDIVADIIYDIIDGVVRQSKVQQARIYDVIDGVVSQSKVEQTHIYDVIDGVVSQSKVEQTHIYDVIDGEVSQSNVQQARIYDVIDGVVSQSKVQQAPIYDVTDGQVSQSKVEQTPSKSKKHSKCKRQSNSKRKSDSQNMYSFPKKPRLLKYEDNRESELPHSTRSRSKGYRISYAEIDSSSDQSDASDLDDIFSDSDITDDEDSIATEDKIQGSNECELTDNSVQKKSKTGKKMDEEDPDFDVRTYFLTQFAKKKLTGAEVDYSEDDSEDQSVMPAKHPSSDNHTDSPASAESSNTDKKTLDRGKVYYDREKVKARMLERKLEERCKRIKVFLKDHPDKYYTEEQVSVERKFRGLQEAEKTFELLVCSICNLFRTSNKVQLETHIEHHLNGDWKCKKCTFEGNSIKEYRKHYKENHPLQPRFKCVICKEKFGIKKRFHEHLVTVHNMLPYVCTLCSTADNPVMFKEEQEHHQHYLEHHKDHMQQCPHCGVHFINQIIERHRCQEETDRSTCDICGKEMRRASIRIHKARVHDNVRPFPCQQCNYAARSSEALRDHVSAKHEG